MGVEKVFSLRSIPELNKNNKIGWDVYLGKKSLKFYTGK